MDVHNIVEESLPTARTANHESIDDFVNRPVHTLFGRKMQTSMRCSPNFAHARRGNRASTDPGNRTDVMADFGSRCDQPAARISIASAIVPVVSRNREQHMRVAGVRFEGMWGT